MIYIRIIFVVFVLLYVFYYILLIGHLLELWKITDKEITLKGILIPFYYFKHIIK